MYVFNAFWMRFLTQFQPALAGLEQVTLVYPLNGTLTIDTVSKHRIVMHANFFNIQCLLLVFTVCVRHYSYCFGSDNTRQMY